MKTYTKDKLKEQKCLFVWFKPSERQFKNKIFNILNAFTINYDFHKKRNTLSCLTESFLGNELLYAENAQYLYESLILFYGYSKVLVLSYGYFTPYSMYRAIIPAILNCLLLIKICISL